MSEIDKITLSTDKFGLAITISTDEASITYAERNASERPTFYVYLKNHFTDNEVAQVISTKQSMVK